MSDLKNKSAITKKFTKIIGSNAKSPMNASKSRSDQKVSRLNDKTNESTSFVDKDYVPHKNRVDSIDATFVRTLDSSNAKDSFDVSLSTSQAATKKKMISLLLERSKMSPTKDNQEGSITKIVAVPDAHLKSNNQRISSENKENQAVRHTPSSANASLFKIQKTADSVEEKKLGSEGGKVLRDKGDIQVSEFTIEDTKPPKRLDEQEINLQVAVSSLNIKTFLTIRSILKPHPLIQDATHALLCLFSGLSDLIPPQIIQRQRVDWKEIKNYLQSPTVLVNYVNCFKDICYQIDVASVSRAYRLINSTKPDDNYSSDVYKTLRDFIKAAIAYYLHIFPQYSVLNLHLYEPNLQDDSIDFEQQPKRAVPSRNQTPKATRNSKSPTVLHTPSAKTSQSPFGRSRTPTNAAASSASKKPVNQAMSVVQYATPKASRPKTPSTNPTKEFFPTSGSKSPAIASRYNFPKANIQQSVHITPKAKSSKVFNMNKSYDEVKPKTATDSQTRQKKQLIDKVLDEKSYRSVSPTSKGAYIKPEMLIEDKDFLEELTVRMQLEAETQTHKKVAKQFKQKITKLLNDEKKRVKQEAKIEQAIKDEANREFEKQERKRLDEFISKKEDEEKQYDLENYQDKQLFRLIKKQIQKEREDDYQYHELAQNLERHFDKVVESARKRKDHHDLLKERLVKLKKDKQYRQQKELQQKEEEAQEFKNKRQNALIWKNAEALKDRIEAEEEYHLLDKLINRN